MVDCSLKLMHWELQNVDNLTIVRTMHKPCVYICISNCCSFYWSVTLAVSSCRSFLFSCVSSHLQQMYLEVLLPLQIKTLPLALCILYNLCHSNHYDTNTVYRDRWKISPGFAQLYSTFVLATLFTDNQCNIPWNTNCFNCTKSIMTMLYTSALTKDSNPLRGSLVTDVISYKYTYKYTSITVHHNSTIINPDRET